MRSIFVILISFSSISQTLLKYDNVENWNWTGFWYGVNGNYHTNAKVSGTSSASIYGAGNGTSAIEQDWYTLPNVDNLNPLFEYEFRFRLGSYFFSNSTATTRGVDVPDFIDVQVSRDGELTYTSELRITGNTNAYWNYNTLGNITHIANGSFSSGDTYQSAVGNNNGLSTSYSVIRLKITGVTQIAIDVLARVNSAGEEWWMDNFELWQMTQPLAVELIDFYYDKGLRWSTYSETNSDYFTLKHSLDGYSWNVAATVKAAGNSTDISKYYFITDLKGYFSLFETDFDGNTEFLKTIFVPNKQRILVNVVNMLGQSVDLHTATGVILLIYSDGTTERVLK